ncbi:MAG: bis(5'-nucleosyl)-tetraphosphatase (symmetrical) YqeK [Chloroflexi bacterium]|nr:bis(5'-nucleosyl)-tetraphosphatase (symmetrical) YqeK [Chloroflexota bacterium]
MTSLPRGVEKRLRALPDGLLEHIDRVKAEAKALAERHAVDPARVYLAAATHDLFRAAGDDALLREATRYRLKVHPLERHLPLLLHGPVAARWLEAEVGIRDQAVLSAVRLHTTGGKGMGPVAKIVFIADKLDPQKVYRYPWIDRVRALADTSLDRAVLEFLERQTSDLLDRGELVHPRSSDLREELAATLGAL